MSDYNVNKYDVGELVILQNWNPKRPQSEWGFRNGAGVLVNPPGVVCKVWKPDSGVPTIYTYGIDSNLQRLSIGRYRCTIEATQSGTWYYRFESKDPSTSLESSLRGAKEASFEVNWSAFGDWE